MRIQSETQFENLYIYVSDALRYDTQNSYFPENQIIKTVSSSPISCSSFSTIISGLYPPQHGVDSFSKVLPEQTRTLFDLFSDESPCHHTPASVVNEESAVPYNDTKEFVSKVESLDSPFFAFDRETITHAPYSFDVLGSEYEKDDIGFSSDAEYWDLRKREPKKVKQEYEDSIDLSIERFKNRVNTLEKGGILDSTLVIFTADHGELLGEHGFYGHGNFLVPEVVYVPTVFYNDSITVNGEFMGLVDIFPTVSGLLGVGEIEDLPGYDLTDGAPDRRLIYSDNSYEDNNVTEWSAWDKNGGYTFTDVEWGQLLYDTVGEITTRGATTKLQRRHPIKIFRNSLRRKGGHSFGNPNYTRQEARQFSDEIQENDKDANAEPTDLDEDVKERLVKLGYK